MSDSCKIKVAVRCRPVKESVDDDQLGTNQCMHLSTHIIYEEKSIILKENSFKFDHVFPSASNEEVYQSTIAPNMIELFKGHNLTVLAYGATGSGKTFTMGTHYDSSKDDMDEGIILRSVKNIFKTIENKENTIFAVRISFIEVYGEDVFDLLQPKSSILPNLKQEFDGFRIPNLTEVLATSSEEVFSLLRKGCLARKTGATAKNPRSSRSHGIFTINIEQTDKTTSVQQRSKFLLVDLAGSERIDTSQTSGQQMKEGININKGLLTLRQVIKALAESRPHVPYRDSKLTKILQESLGGNSHTIMIACIYPLPSNLEETLSTLRYASLASSIVNRPKTFMSPAAEQIMNLKKQVAELQYALKRAGKSIGSDNFRHIGTETDPSSYRDLLFMGLLNSSKDLSVKMRENDEKTFRVPQTAAAKTDGMKKDSTNSIGDEQSILDVTKMCEDSPGTLMELTTNASCNDVTYVFSDDPEEFDDLSAELNKISERMSSNADTVKTLETYSKLLEQIDKNQVAHLMGEIERLTEQKEKLEDLMKNTVDESLKSDKVKIENLEKQIKDLRNELMEKKKLLLQKEKSKTEIARLKKENDTLKQMKVNLMKKIKEASTKFTNLNFEKKKEITRLVKDSRKKEFEFVRLRTKLENEVNVLKKKVDLISKKKHTKITSRVKPSKRPKSQKESLEILTRDTVDIVIGKKITEMLNKKTEEEIKSVLPSFQKYETDAEENLTTEEKIQLKETIETAKLYATTIMAKAAEEIKDSNIDDAIQSFMNSILSYEDAKQGIVQLFKEFLSFIEKMYKEKEDMCNELQESNKKIRELENCLNSEKESNSAQIDQLTHQKIEVDEMNSKLVEEVAKLSERLDMIGKLEGESQMLEKIKLQECEIANLREVVESYKKRDVEIQSLSKNLLRAKKGKSTPWLGRVPTASSSKEELSQSLVEEFLNETLDESYDGCDKDDPDWRATPVHKRKKELSRKIQESSDDESPPKKKSLTVTGCSCPGGCKTMRCKCRKLGADCSNNCSCKLDCANCPNTITT